MQSILTHSPLNASVTSMHYGDRVSRLRDQIIAPVDPLGFILSGAGDSRDVDKGQREITPCQGEIIIILWLEILWNT